jgi:outer membrane protein
VSAHAQRVFSLREAVDTALRNNLELKQTQLQMESSAIDWRQSKANLFPTLNGFANHGINQGRSIDPFSNSYIDQQINFAGYGLATGVTLFNGFGLVNSIRQSSFAYEASKMDVQQQRDNLTLDVILAYLQVMSNEDLLVQAQNQVTVSMQQVERLEKMNKEGAIAPSLLSNLQGELAGNELALVNAQNSLELARLQLFQLMNVPYDATAKFEKVTADAFLAKYDATSAEVYQAALDNLAMVKAAGLRKMSSEKAVQAAKGLMFPRLSFNGNVNTNYSSAAHQSTFLNNSEVETDSYVLVNGDKAPVVSVQPNFKSDRIQYNKQLSNNLYTTVSLDLTVPLFNNFSARNRVKKAALQLKNNTYVEETTRIQLRQSVEQAYANMTAARNRYDALTKQVEAFALSFRIAEVRFNAGVETVIDFVIAKNNLDRSNSNLIIARYDYLLRTKILDYYRGKALW